MPTSVVRHYPFSIGEQDDEVHAWLKLTETEVRPWERGNDPAGLCAGSNRLTFFRARMVVFDGGSR
jgi:hypothetical protein